MTALRSSSVVTRSDDADYAENAQDRPMGSGPSPSLMEQLKDWAIMRMQQDTPFPTPETPQEQQLIDRTAQVIAAFMWAMKTATPNATALHHMFMARNFLIEDIGKAIRTAYDEAYRAPATYDRHICLTVLTACLQDPEGWKLPLNMARGMFGIFEDKDRARGYS